MVGNQSNDARIDPFMLIIGNGSSMRRRKAIERAAKAARESVCNPDHAPTSRRQPAFAPSLLARLPFRAKTPERRVIHLVSRVLGELDVEPVLAQTQDLGAK